MHTCPFCGQECDCDMDDTGDLPVPEDCPHICEEDSDIDDYEEYRDEAEMDTIPISDERKG